MPSTSPFVHGACDVLGFCLFIGRCYGLNISLFCILIPYM